MSKYEDAVQAELARQQAEYEKAQNSGDYSAQASDEATYAPFIPSCESRTRRLRPQAQARILRP